MIRIQVYKSDGLVSEFESSEDREISIGRAQGCSICLDEGSISRLHAVIFPLGGGWALQRKANFGAVLLNGQEVENAPLEGGEEIQIGAFSLRIQIDAAQSSNQIDAGSSKTRTMAVLTSEGGENTRTRFVSSSVAALFRMEPGSANIDEFLMEKDVALFGRGSNCDVILTEKKASRKHFEVRRQGLSFFLKDLNSANGTLVNGSAVTEAELVAGDLIQVGESKIEFTIENKEYFAKQDQFLPVPAHLTEAAAAMDMGAFSGAEAAGMAGESSSETAAEGKAELGPDGVPLPAKPNSNTDFIGWAKYKWALIPRAQRMRYLAILVVGCLVMAMLGTPDDEKPKPPQRKPVAGGVRRFEDRTPKDQAFIRENYKQLLSAHDKKDFQTMFERARNILALVDDYNDTKSYEQIAKRGLDQIEEEKKRKDLEEKQRKVREEVAKLEEKGQGVFERALKEPVARRELDSVIQEIYAKDPNNRKAADWKQAIKEKIEQEKQAEKLAREREELRQKAEDEYARVERIFNDEKYLEAIKEADKLADVGWSEKDYLDKVEKLKVDIREKLRSVLDPLLAEARNQRAEGGDLVKAREKYKEVLRIDTANQEALAGIREIRQVLILRAKRFYAEAILAESISDLTEAKEKYEKCLHTAPDDPDLSPNRDYHGRCRRKLERFEAFNPEGGGKN